MTKNLLAGLALTGLALSAHADILVQWNFEAAVAPAPSTSWTGIAASTGTGSGSGVHALSSTWSTFTGNGSSKGIAAANWSVGDYWQFSFASTGFTSLGVSWDQIGSNTGPANFKLAYSTDGTTFFDVSGYTVANVTWNSSTPVTTSFYSFDLSGVTALNNAGTVFLRLVDTSTTAVNGTTVASGGTGRLDNFTVVATPVPEAGTTAMLLAGLATVAFVAVRRKA